MSTLKLGTIATQDGTESTEVTNVVNGSAKAWVNFNGSGTVAIRRGFNVSSITDNSTGNFTVNFATAMTDANYSAQVANPFATNATSCASPFSFTAGSVKAYFSLSGVAIDTGIGSVAIFS